MRKVLAAVAFLSTLYGLYARSRSYNLGGLFGMWLAWRGRNFIRDTSDRDFMFIMLLPAVGIADLLRYILTNLVPWDFASFTQTAHAAAVSSWGKVFFYEIPTLQDIPQSVWAFGVLVAAIFFIRTVADGSFNMWDHAFRICAYVALMALGRFLGLGFILVFILTCLLLTSVPVSIWIASRVVEIEGKAYAFGRLASLILGSLFLVRELQTAGLELSIVFCLALGGDLFTAAGLENIKNMSGFHAEVRNEFRPDNRETWLSRFCIYLRRFVPFAFATSKPKSITLHMTDTTRGFLEARCSKEHVLCKLCKLEPQLNSPGAFTIEYKELNFDSESNLDYVALSHAWWPPQATECVRSFTAWDVMWKKGEDIWESVYAATNGNWFWIDVLCLPQKRTNGTTQWEYDQKECMGRLLENLTDVYKNSTRTIILIKGEKCPILTESSLKALAEASTDFRIATAKLADSLSLISDPWFVRLWPCLELVVSERVSFYVTGSHSCDIGCLTGVRISESARELWTEDNRDLQQLLSRVLYGNAGPFEKSLIKLCNNWVRQAKVGLAATPLDNPGQIEEPSQILTTSRKVEREADYFVCAALLLGKDCRPGPNWKNSSIAQIAADFRSQILADLDSTPYTAEDIVWVSKVPIGAYFESANDNSATSMYGFHEHVYMLKPRDSLAWLDMVGEPALHTNGKLDAVLLGPCLETFSCLDTISWSSEGWLPEDTTTVYNFIGSSSESGGSFKECDIPQDCWRYAVAQNSDVLRNDGLSVAVVCDCKIMLENSCNCFTAKCLLRRSFVDTLGDTEIANSLESSVRFVCPVLSSLESYRRCRDNRPAGQPACRSCMNRFIVLISVENGAHGTREVVGSVIESMSGDLMVKLLSSLDLALSNEDGCKVLLM